MLNIKRFNFRILTYLITNFILLSLVWFNSIVYAASEEEFYDMEDLIEEFEEENEKEEESENKILGEIIPEVEIIEDNILRLIINAQGIQKPVLGISFHLKFDHEKIQFLRYEPGGFLEKGGDPIYMVEKKANGKIIFGETLTHDSNFPLGKGTITTFYFEIIDESFGEVDFEFFNPVVSSIDLVRQDLDKIVWKNLNLNENGKESLSISSESPNIEAILELENSNHDSKQKVGLIILGVIFVVTIILIFIGLRKSGKKHGENSVNFK